MTRIEVEIGGVIVLSSSAEVHIIGAGPAGVGAAVALARAGLKVLVHEAMSKPGLKPCGRGIPVVGDLPVDVPKESIVRRIREAVMYVNGKYLFTLRDVFTGFIVDKTAFLEAALASAGVEVLYKSKFDARTGRIGGPGGLKPEKGLFAGGHPYYDDEKIMALQYIIETREYDDSESLEIYFDTELLGYYYIFPGKPGAVEVGVGGFASPAKLRHLLDKFVKERENLRDKRIVKVEGAKIAIGGLSLGTIAGLPKIGEAAGFVLPLTGEGIRPSMLSGYAAGLAIAEGKDPIKAQRETKIAEAIDLQSRVLNAVLRLTPSERAEILKALPPEMHAELSLGRIGYKRLLRELAKRPGSLVKLLKALS